MFYECPRLLAVDLLIFSLSFEVNFDLCFRVVGLKEMLVAIEKFMNSVFHFLEWAFSCAYLKLLSAKRIYVVVSPAVAIEGFISRLYQKTSTYQTSLM